ncbi:MAG: OmpA family protein, partial [Prevotella melaninogenica]
EQAFRIQKGDLQSYSPDLYFLNAELLANDQLTYNEAKKALDDVKAGRHVQIVGTASPEGPKALNDRLSQNRADVVAKYLQSRGVIVDEAKGQGVQGVTSNRLAVVYVK